MNKKKIIILGAGLAGLSTAWHLQKKGLDCQVFEKESEVGGLCRSKRINGFTFDYDGHLLHFKHNYTFNLVKDLLGNNLVEHKRSAWVYSHGCYTRYPFQAKLHGLPPSIIKECLLGFLEISRNGHPRDKKYHTFLDWINHTFGKGIARHFMVPYNTKFWTLAPEELTCGWLDGHIPVPSLNQVIEGTIEDNKREFGYNVNFWYPRKGGILSVPLALAAQVKNIHTNCRITEINLERQEIKTSSGIKERFDSLISTIPLPEMPYIVKGIPGRVLSLVAKLKWNSVFNLNLGINKKDISGRHWVYFPQKDISFFRVGFTHNFSDSIAPAGKGSLYIEVAYSKDKPIDKKKITSRIKSDLRRIGVLFSGERIHAEQANDIEYGYPIYDVNYDKVRGQILEYLRRGNIIPCGRYGSWRYMSMEESILDGRSVAMQFK